MSFRRRDLRVSFPTKEIESKVFLNHSNKNSIFIVIRLISLFQNPGRLVDDSILQAYVQMIRNAENFIYIENQYFMGSAFAWLSESDTNCRHIIPVEIVQKIIDKIQLGQRFVAYIVIPMFPEGDPTSAPIQV